MRPPPESAWQIVRGLDARQRHTFIASYLGWTLDAFDFFILVMVVRHVAADFRVAKETVTYAIFLTLAMRPAGALVFGLLADRYGRRPTLMFNVAFFSLLELLSGFAPSMGWFLVLRALYGFGMGGEWGVGASLVMETVPARARGVLSGILQEGYPVGYLLAAVAYKCAYPYVGWRGMFFVGCLPALVVLYIRGYVPESPVWERAHAGRGPRARWADANAIGQAVRTHWRLFLFLVLLMTAFNFYSHGTQDLYPSVLLEGQRHLPEQTVGTIVIIYNLGALAGGILFGTCSQSWGRRRTMMAAALLALPLIPVWAFATRPVLVAAGAFCLQFMVQGAWGVVPAHLNELAPAAVRGTFPGLAYQLGNLFAAGTSTLEAGLAARHGHDYGWALAVVTVAGSLTLAFLAYVSPEARDADFLPALAGP